MPTPPLPGEPVVPNRPQDAGPWPTPDVIRSHSESLIKRLRALGATIPESDLNWVEILFGLAIQKTDVAAIRNAAAAVQQETPEDEGTITETDMGAAFHEGPTQLFMDDEEGRTFLFYGKPGRGKSSLAFEPWNDAPPVHPATLPSEGPTEEEAVKIKDLLLQSITSRLGLPDDHLAYIRNELASVVKNVGP